MGMSVSVSNYFKDSKNVATSATAMGGMTATRNGTYTYVYPKVTVVIEQDTLVYTMASDNKTMTDSDGLVYTKK